MDSENLNMTAVQRFRTDLAFGKYQEIAGKLLNLLDELERLEAKNAELKVELAKFYPCEPVQHGLGQPGVVCIDYAHMGINHVGEVWHKEEE